MSTSPSPLNHPIQNLLERLCQRRGLDLQTEMSASLADLCSPSRLTGMDRLADQVAHAIVQKQPLVVVGDYDADGATSTALMTLGLRAMGAQKVTYCIPDRFGDGYGLNPTLLEKLPKPPGCLITVDNGIQAYDGILKAKARGWTVCITDHHEPGSTLPEADSIINPKLCTPEAFPAQNLAGVGVTLYALRALKAELNQRAWFNAQTRPAPNCASWLDLVALGTVADMVPLDATNRILVRAGLQRIRLGEGSIGLQTLLKRLGLRSNWTPAADLTTTDLSFRVIPLINAAGRMADIRPAVELLLAPSEAAAKPLVNTLINANAKRRRLQENLLSEALDQMHRETWTRTDDPAIVVYHPHWHLGVLGILAAQLKTQGAKPVLALGKAPNGQLRGSFRADPGIGLATLLARLDREHPQLIVKFGGHDQAAGLTLEPEQLPQFISAFLEAIPKNVPKLVEQTDGELPKALYRADTYTLLHRWIPWGKGCPEPSFEGNFQILSCEPFAQGKHWRMKLKPLDSTLAVPALFFSPSRACLPLLSPGKRVKVEFSLKAPAAWSKTLDPLQFSIHRLHSLDPTASDQSLEPVPIETSPSDPDPSRPPWGDSGPL